MPLPPDYHSWTSIEQIEFHFPSFKNGNGYRNTSEATIQYNCLAWALGIDWAWYAPEPKCAGYVWFPGVERKWDVEIISTIVERHGYQRCPDSLVEEGFEKIVFFLDSDGRPEHFARQLENGKWTSKLGNLNDIEHDTLDSLLAPDTEGYHSIERVFKRARK